jgi:hypothetical protein
LALLGRLWEWIDGLYLEMLTGLPPTGGRLTEAERRELRRWLERTLQQRHEGGPEGARHPDEPGHRRPGRPPLD